MTVEEAKVALPLPALLHREGLGDHAKKSALCPFHDDKSNSFSIYKNDAGAFRWKCFAGCGRGDEVAFLEKHKGISQSDAAKLFIEMAGGSNGSAPIARAKKATSADLKTLFDWQQCVADFNEKHLERLGEWRGFTGGFCSWLRGRGHLGLWENCIAFPVRDTAGKVVAVHYRLKDGSWRYHPKGTKVQPFVIGDLKTAKQVHIFESQWDMFAFMDRTQLYQNPTVAFVATRGGENAKLVEGLFGEGVSVCAWPQNDAPGMKWLSELPKYSAVPIAKAIIPAPHKDMNAWTKAGASAEDIQLAFFKNELVEVPKPQASLSPEKLFSEIKDYITRYVVFSQPEHADVVALWVMHTWVVDQADYTPYIYLHSPIMQCGKTQVQRVVEPLVKNPLRTCNISESGLFREIEESHPTLLWDEIDSIFGSRKTSEANENKRALLNAGHERGMRAIRMERSSDGFKKISFDPFCPKILAGIGRIPDTIVDRSIPILIHRRLKTQSCQKFRRRDRDNAKPLREALEAWSKDVELLKILRASQPKMPDSMSDRQEDIWEPLLAIADAIGGDTPQLAREAARVLCDNDDELGYGATELAAIRKVVGDESQIRSADLITGLWDADALPSRLMEDEEPNHKKIGHWLSKFIKSYGGKPVRKLRFGEQTSQGYDAAELKQVFDRYCPPEHENP